MSIEFIVTYWNHNCFVICFLRGTMDTNKFISSTLGAPKFWSSIFDWDKHVFEYLFFNSGVALRYLQDGIIWNGMLIDHIDCLCYESNSLSKKLISHVFTPVYNQIFNKSLKIYVVMGLMYLAVNPSLPNWWPKVASSISIWVGKYTSRKKKSFLTFLNNKNVFWKYSCAWNLNLKLWGIKSKNPKSLRM